MGNWGTAILSSDLAADLKEEIKDYLADGKSPAEARLQLARDNEIDLEANNPDTREFIIVMALLEWKLGRLETSVQRAALNIIDTGDNLEDWKLLGADQTTLKKRAAVLQKLKETLLSPPPAPKNIKKRPTNITPYTVGDVFFFHHINGCYYLFLVTGHLTDKGGTYTEAWQLDCSFDDKAAMQNAKLKKLAIRKNIGSLLFVDWYSRNYQKLIRDNRIGLAGKMKVKKNQLVSERRGSAAVLLQTLEPEGKVYRSELFEF